MEQSLASPLLTRADEYAADDVAVTDTELINQAGSGDHSGSGATTTRTTVCFTTLIADAPAFKLALEESVYPVAPLITAACMAEPTLKQQMIMFSKQALPYWLLSMLAWVLQSSSIYYIREFVFETGVDCKEVPIALELLSLSIYTGLCLIEAYENVKFVWYFLSVPQRCGKCNYCAQDDDDEHRRHAHFKDFIFTTDQRGQVLAFVPCSDGGGYWPSWFPITFSIVVGLPRLGVTTALWWFGTGFLLQRGETVSDIILNTVALIFVLEIDDYIYLATVPDSIRAATVENWPAIEIEQKKTKDGWFNWSKHSTLYAGWITPVIIALMTNIAHHVWC